MFKFINSARNLFSDGETVFLHNEITSIIDRLSSPKKNKHVTNTIAAIPVIALNERYENDNENESVAEQPIESQTMKLDFINEMQIQGAINDNGLIETVVSDVNVEKYRQMIPYDTTDADKISQQESILELLISNGIFTNISTEQCSYLIAKYEKKKIVLIIFQLRYL